MIIKVESGAYSRSFYPVLISQHRYLICFGGRGGGKTDTLYLKYLLELFQPYYFKLLYVNKEHRNIRDQQYAGFKRVAKRTGLYDRLKFYDGDYRIVNEANGNALIPKGMDDPEKTKSTDDITAIWWDEINRGTAEDFLTLNALLRSPMAEYLQFCISFNPVSEQHWLRKQFFDKSDAYALNETYADGLLHHSTYRDNDFIDKDAYLKTLQDNAMGNVNRMLVDIEGKWGVIMNENPFFYAYDHTVHYVDTRFTMPEQFTYIYLAFDFNNDPCTLVVGMVHDKQISVIDLIACDANTVHGLSPLEACCERFLDKYVRSGLVTVNRIIVTGDATGRSAAADNAANRNFYTKIKERLRISDGQVKVRKANTTHRLSMDICNSALYHCQVRFYKSAYLVTEDMQKAYADRDGTLNPAKREHGLHYTDAFRYFIDCVLNFDQWQQFIKYYAKAS